MPDGVTKPPLKLQPSPLLPFMLALLALVVGCHQLLVLLGSSDEGAADAEAAEAGGAEGREGEGDGGGHVRLLSHVAAPLVTGLVLLLLLLKNGKFLVNRPQLCPHLAATVPRSSGSKKKQQ